MSFRFGEEYRVISGLLIPVNQGKEIKIEELELKTWSIGNLEDVLNQKTLDKNNQSVEIKKISVIKEYGKIEEVRRYDLKMKVIINEDANMKLYEINIGNVSFENIHAIINGDRIEMKDVTMKMWAFGRHSYKLSDE